LAAIEGASGAGLCKLKYSVDLKRDRALLGHVLDLAWERRRSEHERTCTFELLVAMKANERLAEVAAEARTQSRWQAIVGWGARNLRARHYGVYKLALERGEVAVRVAAIVAWCCQGVA